jgi:hypothetical protein
MPRFAHARASDALKPFPAPTINAISFAICPPLSRPLGSRLHAAARWRFGSIIDRDRRSSHSGEQQRQAGQGDDREHC